MDAEHLRSYVIRPTLWHIGLHSDAAEDLVLGTACVESDCGRYLRQLGGGPARGICQMEPRTHEDIWTHYLRYRDDLASRIYDLRPHWPSSPEMLVTSLAYSVALCRIHYLRTPEPLPLHGDVEAAAAYWKEHYNTHLGAGRPEHYVEAWRRHVGAP